MSIENTFSRELKRLERMPERALYKQTRKFTKTTEQKVLQQLTNKKQANKKRRIGIEILWFFSTLVIALIVSFILFYLIGEFLPNVFIIAISEFKSLLYFYLALYAICFIGTYFARLVVWALHSLKE